MSRNGLFLQLFKSRRTWGVLIPSVLVNIVVLVVFFAAQSTQRVVADQALLEHQRTTYDILVRAPDKVSAIEKEYGLVEANHLNGTAGGITLQQYEQIKAIPNVEVAAPIAVLGYMNRSPLVILIKDPLPPGIYRVQAAAGIIEGGQHTTAAQLSPYYALHTPTNPDYPHLAQWQFDGWSQELYRLNMSITSGGFQEHSGTFMIKLPSMHDRMLVAAIDPEQEARLVNLDQMLVSGEYLPQDPDYVEYYSTLYVPILFNIHDYIQQYLSVDIERVDFEMDITKNFAEQISPITDVQVLHTLPLEPAYSMDLDVQRVWYKNAMRLLVEGGDITGVAELNSEIGGYIYEPTAVQYRVVESPPASLPQGMLVLQAIPQGLTQPETRAGDEFLDQQMRDWIALLEWEMQPEVTYRTLSLRYPYLFSFAPYFMGNGQFEIDTTTALGGSPLNQVPLETYLPPSAILKYDANGEALAVPQTLTPTLNNEGYLVSPPDMLISLTSAMHILENACFEYLPAENPNQILSWRPVSCKAEEDIISAIRVRVGGIDAMDSQAQARIEAVADEIVRQTGLHVDVMVGSSPQPVLVHIPGYEGVGELGYVEEYWVKKNVKTLIQSGMNLADGVLFSAMLAAGVLLLFNLNTFLMLSRLSEVALYHALGWRRSRIIKRLLGEVLRVGLMSVFLAGLAALLVMHLFSLQGALWQIALVMLLELGVFLLSALLPAAHVARRAPITYLQRGDVFAWFTTHSLLTMRNYVQAGILRKPVRSVTILLGSMIASGLLGVLFFVQTGLDGQLYGTLLGRWIRSSIEPYHLVMGGTAMLLTALNIFLSTRVNVDERKDEIGLMSTFGWKRSVVARLFCGEAVSLSALGALLGSALAVGLYFLLLQTGSTSIPWVQGIALALAFPLGLAALSAYVPAYQGAGELPLLMLQEKAGKARTRTIGKALRYALAGVAAALLVAVIVLFTTAPEGWLPAAAPEEGVSPLVSATPTPTQSALQPTPTPWRVENAPQYAVSLEMDEQEGLLLGQQSIRFTNQTGMALDALELRLYPNLPPLGPNVEELLEVEWEQEELRLKVGNLRLNGELVEGELLAYRSVLRIPLEEELAVGEQCLLELSFSLERLEEMHYFADAWYENSFFPLLSVHDESGWRRDVCLGCMNVVFNESANIDLSITLPQDWQVVVSGDLLAQEQLGAGRQRLQYRAQQMRDISLVMSEDVKQATRQVGDVVLTLIMQQENPDADMLLEHFESAYTYFSDLFGAYPYQNLFMLAERQRYSSGKETSGLVYVVYNPQEGLKMERILVHEIAHQWWYGVVGNDIFHEAWLDESLAEYATLLYLRDQNGEQVFQEILSEYEASANAADAFAGEAYTLSTPTEELAKDGYMSNILYHKGALFLDALRVQMGEESFLEGLRTYYQEYRYGIADGLGFMHAMQQHTSINLQPLFDEWVW